MGEDRVLSLLGGGGGVCAVSMWLRQLDSEARDQSPAARKTELQTC